MAGEDRAYTNWLRLQECCVCGGPNVQTVHHHTAGPTHADDERPDPKALGGKRGKSQTAHDHYAMPAHIHCHNQIQRLKGPFQGMSKQAHHAWQDEQVTKYRTRYLEEQQGKDAALAIGEPASALPVADPSWDVQRELSEGLDAKRIARRFSDHYGIESGQARHDLERLLQWSFITGSRQRRTG